MTLCKLLKITILALLIPSAVGAEGIRILFIGDSVTDGGWGRSGGAATPSKDRVHWDLNHIYGHSYMMLCASELESSSPQRGYVFFNRGISGDDIYRIRDRYDEDAIQLDPDVISILEGTNDIHYYLEERKKGNISDFDIDSWEKTFRSLLKKTLGKNPETRFVLCTPFVARVGNVGKDDDYPLREELVDRMAKIIREMAKEYDATLVDFNKLFKDLSKGSEGISYWSWDGIHPTPAGHRRMADLWLSKTRRLLKGHK